MSDTKATAPEPELRARYVSGFGVNPQTEKPEGYLVQLMEDAEGNRHGMLMLATGMDFEQVEHLHMQMGKLLDIMRPREDKPNE